MRVLAGVVLCLVAGCADDKPKPSAQVQTTVQTVPEPVDDEPQAEPPVEVNHASEVAVSDERIEHFDGVPHFLFTIKNRSTVPISKVYLHGKLSVPGRTVPWHEGDFNFAIAGGIEPGESAEFKYATAELRNFADMPKPPKNVEIEFTTTEVDWPGKPRPESPF